MSLMVAEWVALAGTCWDGNWDRDWVQGSGLLHCNGMAMIFGSLSRMALVMKISLLLCADSGLRTILNGTCMDRACRGSSWQTGG